MGPDEKKIDLIKNLKKNTDRLPYPPELRWERSNGTWIRRDRAKKPPKKPSERNQVPEMPPLPAGWTQHELDVFWKELRRCNGQAEKAQRLIVAADLFPRSAPDKYVNLVNELRYQSDCYTQNGTGGLSGDHLRLPTPKYSRISACN